jgi:hypothetical protein
VARAVVPRRAPDGELADFGMDWTMVWRASEGEGRHFQVNKTCPEQRMHLHARFGEALGHADATVTTGIPPSLFCLLRAGSIY